jgi:hypothetical protein
MRLAREPHAARGVSLVRIALAAFIQRVRSVAAHTFDMTDTQVTVAFIAS